MGEPRDAVSGASERVLLGCWASNPISDWDRYAIFDAPSPKISNNHTISSAGPKSAGSVHSDVTLPKFLETGFALTTAQKHDAVCVFFSAQIVAFPDGLMIC